MRWSIVICCLGMCWAVLYGPADAQSGESPRLVIANAPAVQQPSIAATIPPVPYAIADLRWNSGRQDLLANDERPIIPTWYPLVLPPTKSVIGAGFANSLNRSPASSQSPFATRLKKEAHWATIAPTVPPVYAARARSIVRTSHDDAAKPPKVAPIANDSKLAKKAARREFQIKFPSSMQSTVPIQSTASMQSTVPMQSTANVSNSRRLGELAPEPDKESNASAIRVVNARRQPTRAVNTSRVASAKPQTRSRDDVKHVPAELAGTHQIRQPTRAVNTSRVASAKPQTRSRDDVKQVPADLLDTDQIRQPIRAVNTSRVASAKPRTESRDDVKQVPADLPRMDQIRQPMQAVNTSQVASAKPQTGSRDDVKQVPADLPRMEQIRQPMQAVNTSQVASATAQTVSHDDTEQVPAELPVTGQTGDTFASGADGSVDCQTGNQRCDVTRVCRGRCNLGKSCLHPTHGYCPGCFEVSKPGDSLYGHIGAQIANGIADRMVLYRYDFLDALGHTSEKLSPRGRHQLKKIVTRLEVAGGCEVLGVPLCIESSGHEKLDEERRANVITLLGEWEIPFDPNMVVVCTSPPLYGGLQGIEADIIHENMLRSTTSQGSSDGGGNGGGGSSESGITTGGFGSTGGGFGSG